MIVLLPEYPFEFKEREDSEVLTGFYRDLNSRESKDFESQRKKLQDKIKSGEELERSLKRINEQIDIATKTENWAEKEKLLKKKYDVEDKLLLMHDGMNFDEEENEIIKWKMNKCLSGADKSKIIELANQYGYLKVQKVIIEAVNEKK